MSNNNYITQTRTLALLVMFFLMGFSFLTNTLFDNAVIQKIDLLSDIRPEAVVFDSILTEAEVDSTLEVISDTVRVDTTVLQNIYYSHEIEDYSSNQFLKTFTSSLKQSWKSPVRIAFFGDSFIEGDILSGDLRDTLQNKFGGQGVGFVPLASEVSQFRISIQHAFKNWDTYSLVSKKPNPPPLGFSGYCFVPAKDNTVSYKVPRRAMPGFERVRLFYQSFGTSSVEFIIHDSVRTSTQLLRSRELQQLSLDLEKSRTVTFGFTPHDSLYLYGACFETDHGIYIDNFAMRGNSGISLSKINENQIVEFNSFQDYKLIILQYGLNVVNENDSLGYRWYIDRMVNVINRIKKLLPNTPILLISVSDRSSNQNGTMSTIPAIPVMRDAQRTIAKHTGIAFWDLYSAMGGKNSMVKFVENNPPLGAKDYTHLTYLGGKQIAKKLAEAILELYQKHESNP